jgi:phosphotriesterase-related protein
MNRRLFLRAAVLSLPAFARPPVVAAPRAQVMTVTGAMNARSLGLTLMHEHVLVDFIGAERVSPNRYDAGEVFQKALPHLRRVRALGCRTFVDCTPNWLGRDAALLQRLSRAAGLRIVTNTGYYGARNHLFLPAHVATETPEQLAARWTQEFSRGIDGTGIKPGFIKIGVDAGRLSALNEKIVRAAALTHRRTGLTIGAHTGDGVAAMQQLDLLAEHGVSPKAFIWIHAQNEKNEEMHRQAARRGCWVEFDGVNARTMGRHLALTQSMRAAGLLNQVLLSQDSGWYHVGEAGGGEYRGYDFLLKDFVPALRRAGFSAAEIDQLLITNPPRALTLEVRNKEQA